MRSYLIYYDTETWLIKRELLGGMVITRWRQGGGSIHSTGGEKAGKTSKKDLWVCPDNLRNSSIRVFDR